MPQNFLDLHIVDFCQLDCKHCYLNRGKRVMPLNMLRAICEDFLKTDFPLPQSDLILSGGEPLLHCIDYIIALCKKYECNVLNFGMYQTFKKSNKTVRFTEWLKAKEYVSKCAKTLVTCLETGCIAGIHGICVLPDLYYWDCPRHQEIMGRYPQPIREVLRSPEDIMNPFDTCCKYMGW